MSRQRSVLQTFWHIKPTQAVLVQDERRVTGNRVQSFCAYLRLVVGRFSFHESGNVYASPFFRVPPHQFFLFAPGTAIRSRAGTIVDDAAIARPREAPAVTEIIFGFP